MKESRKIKLMRLMEKAKFSEGEIADTIGSLDTHNAMLKGLVEAELVLRAQNQGNCLVSVENALKKVTGK